MSTAQPVVRLKINGREVTGRAGQSVLDVARENDIHIPTLCHLDGLSDVGACRVCMVQMTGSPRLYPACVTPATEGADFVTDSEALTRHRKMVLELLFSERNHICSVCISNGHCELQSVAQEVGVDHVRFSYAYPYLTIDATHPRFAVDHNRCILCTRCVRVCAEIEGANTWGLQARGSHTLVITDLAQPWSESTTCTSCGKCVQACPTGAIFEKGKSVAEMIKRPEIVSGLAAARDGS